MSLMKQAGKAFGKCKKLMLSTKEPLATGAASDSDIAACITGSLSPDTLGYSVEEAFDDSGKLDQALDTMVDKLATICGARWPWPWTTCHWTAISSMTFPTTPAVRPR